jgi:adenine-specific DNA-methyltransferase
LTQKINYIGSKYSLLNFIEESVKISVGDLSDKVFCDLFGGTNIVGGNFRDKVKQVISNDIEYYSYVIAKKYLSNTLDCSKEIEILNSLSGIEGNIFNYYSESGSSKRLYFSEENGEKIDAIRQKIEEWKNKDCYYHLLTLLLEAADKVANTTSVYGAYLKQIKPSATRIIFLKDSETNIIENQNNICYNEDSNELIKRIKGDILYIDTPYNHRQYGSNYHILNAIAKYDFSIEPRGVVGLMDYNKSNYSYKRKVKITFEDLIKNADFEHIFISYNNEGILSVDDFKDILGKYGRLVIFEKDYKTYKADKNRSNKSEFVIEYLFYLKK